MELPVTQMQLMAARLQRAAYTRALAVIEAARNDNFTDVGLTLHGLDSSRFSREIETISGFSLCCELAGDYESARTFAETAAQLRDRIGALHSQALRESVAFICRPEAQ